MVRSSVLGVGLHLDLKKPGLGFAPAYTCGGGEHSLLEPGLGGIRWGFSLADLEVAWCGMRLWQCEE